MRFATLRRLCALGALTLLATVPALADGTPEVGQTFPEFNGKTHDGKEIALADYKGKVVLVDFWATWCGPCVAELPNVRKAYEKYHDQGFEVLAISLDSNNGKLEAWYADAKKTLPWPSIFDGKGWEAELAKRFEIRSIPAAFLLDRTGKVVATGARGGRLHQAIEATLAGKEVPVDMRTLFMKWHKATGDQRTEAAAKLAAAATPSSQDEVNEMAWFYLTEGEPTAEGAALMLAMLKPTIDAGTNGGALDTAALAAHLAGDSGGALDLQVKAVAAVEKETGMSVAEMTANPQVAELIVRKALFAAEAGQTDMANEIFRSLEKSFPAGSPFRKQPHFMQLEEKLRR